MKASFKTTIALCFLLLFVNQWGIAQNCCSPTSAFADLGDNDDFSSAHIEPTAYSGAKIEGESISFPTPDSSPAQGWMIPAEMETDQWLLVFHEWWGLTDHVKEEAQSWSKDLKNVNVLCLDLYDGKTTMSREEAAKLMQSTDEERIRQIIHGARAYIGFRSEVITLGWCFGGGWSLQASIIFQTKSKACVMYYGMPETDTEKLKNLQADVLGIFASKDQWINAEVVKNFEDAMIETQKNLDLVIFDADHAFANPSNPQFDRSAEKQAYRMAIEFFNAYLN